MGSPKRTPKVRPSEVELIETFRRSFSSAESTDVLVGIGDDAAVLQAKGKLVWTIDDSVERVHFKLDWMTLGDAASKAFHGALSDIAAMGAKPLAALCSIAVPSTATGRQLGELRRAQAAAARQLGCPIVGGNVTSGTVWRFTTTALGRATHPVLRSSASPGHELWLLGKVGEAGCGRLWLQRGLPPTSKTAQGRAIAACLRAFRRPRALIETGLQLDGRCHAAIDLSDGLGADCVKLSQASGVRIAIDRDALGRALSRTLRAASEPLGLDPLELALAGGEDYALLVSGPAARRPTGAQAVGVVQAGRGAYIGKPGAWLRCGSGFDHLR